MTREGPFIYEEVFSLILSMTQQFLEDRDSGLLDTETTENYFSRLTKLALGEYEFARRMAFEGIPVVRLAPYKTIIDIYRQRPPEDFIFEYEGKTCCVDVKYYNSLIMQNKIILKKRYVDNVKKFCDTFALDEAYIAIKRFERWYMLKAVDIEDLPKVNGCYEIDINWARNNHEVLDEQHCIFNLGSGRPIPIFEEDKKVEIINPPESVDRLGVYYGSIEINEDDGKFAFTYKENKVEETGIRAGFLTNLYHRIDKNFRTILSEGIYQLDDINGFEDLCPTVFSLIDNIRPFIKDIKDNITDKDAAFSRCITPLSDAKYLIIGDYSDVRYFFYRLWLMKVKKLKEELKIGE